MRTSKWLHVVAGVTLLTGGWSLAGTALGDRLFDAGIGAIGLYALVGAIGFLLTPVFFVALYYDAGVVRRRQSPWTPDRRLWVGGGVLWSLLAYALASNPAVELVGVAYLLRRFRDPVFPDPQAAEPVQTRRSESSHERSVGGVVVHLFALVTGVVGAALVYAASDHEFTKANARHVVNWHLSVIALTTVAFLTFFLGADTLTLAGETTEWSLFPTPIDTVLGLLGTLLLFLAGLSWLFTGVFALIATVKAILGTPWQYPLSWAFVE